jgi:hypothetical protein
MLNVLRGCVTTTGATQMAWVRTDGRNADWIGGIWVGSTIIAWLLCRWRGHSVVAWTLTIHSLLSWPLCRCREQPEGQCGHSRPALSLCDGVMSRFTDHLGRDRRMIAPDEPGEQRDGNADQRRAGDGEGEEVALALRSDTSAWIGLG